jgi:hypothetical protein
VKTSKETVMVQSLAIEKGTIYDLEQRFGLSQIEDSVFFAEWQEPLPPLTLEEQHRLARVQASYANLDRRSVLENTVKLAVVAPLLDLAGFFLPPFYVDTEKEVQITAEDEGGRTATRSIRCAGVARAILGIGH